MIQGYKPARVQGYKAAKFQHSWLRGCEAATVIRASFGTVSASNKNKLFTLGPEDPDSILIREICHSTQKKRVSVAAMRQDSSYSSENS